MLGMLRTLKRIAVRWLASTSIFATLALPAYSPASWSRIGATIWQGPHHDAQKSTRMSPFACSISVAKEASLTCTAGEFVAPILLFSCRLKVFGGLVADRPRIAHIGIAVPDLETAVAF